MLLQVQSFSDGREYLANGLRSYADGLLDEAAEREFLTLYRVYQRQDVYRLWSGQLTDTAFFSYQEPSLGKAVAAALYGQTISGSVSPSGAVCSVRLCPFSALWHEVKGAGRVRV